MSNEASLVLLLHHEELCNNETDPGYVANHKDHHNARKNPPMYQVKPICINIYIYDIYNIQYTNTNISSLK